VLNDAATKSAAGVGLLSEQLAQSFGQATLFWGTVPLHSTFMNSDGWEVKLVAGLMIVLMTASQFYTQLQIVSKNTTDEVKASPTYRTQRIMLYLLPLVFIFSGLAFPLGVMFYWLTTNIWTMVQQFIVIRSMPTPGSEAYRMRQERLRLKGKLPPEEVKAIEDAAKPKHQRVQPVSKNRAKKQGGGQPGQKAGNPPKGQSGGSRPASDKAGGASDKATDGTEA